jgi:predicted MFS family arabinose efflux permease
VVRSTLLIGASVFAVFSMFWTGLTFLLSAAPFNYSLSQIGMVGLAGFAGAMAAKNAGKLHDRGLSVPATGWALALTLASLLMAGLGATSIAVIIVVVIVLDAAIQGVNVLNQTRLMTVDPAARSRMNSAFVVSNFIGGAIGSTLASWLWHSFGWTGLMTAAALLTCFALAVWAMARPTFSQIR